MAVQVKSEQTKKASALRERKREAQSAFLQRVFTKKEILNYFDNSWEIISIKENNSPSFEGAHVDCVKDHFHRFGYVLARRLK